MSGRFISCAGLAILGLFCFLALRWVYDYVLVFQSETNDCFFLFSSRFLNEFSDHPAGLLRYAGRFLGQFYYYPWLGAVIVAVSITCFGVLFRQVLAKLNGTADAAQALLPCLLLLALHTSTIWLVHDTLGLLASCAAFLGYLSISSPGARRVYALAATPVLYFALGVYVWLFVAWIVGSECAGPPWRAGLWFKAAYPLISIATPLAAWRWVFPIPLSSALACPILFGPPFRTGIMDYHWAAMASECVLAAMLAGSVLLFPFWGRLFGGTSLAAFWRVKPDRRSRIALAAAAAALLFLLHAIRYDPELNLLMACRQVYKQRRWDALLDKVAKNPTGDLHIQFMTNFALCQKGRLLDEMFLYPQSWGTRGLVLHFTAATGVAGGEDDTWWAIYNSDLFYELGHINASFRHAFNLWTRGARYDALTRMAECSMVNGNYALAEKYLSLLERTWFYRDVARRYREILADPEAVEREFGPMRERLPVTDGMMYKHPTVPFLTLLEARPDNRMALDYLTAWLLLDKGKLSIAAVSRGMDSFRKAGYTSLPIHCQEAMLLVERGERTKVDLNGFQYDGAIAASVDRFLQAAAESQAGTAEPAGPVWGSAYLYYYFFMPTPQETRPRAQPEGGFGGTSRQE